MRSEHPSVRVCHSSAPTSKALHNAPVCHSLGGEARRDLGGEASTSLELTDRVRLMEVPGRCIGLGKMEHSNGAGRGRHVELGPVWSLCDIENNGSGNSTPVPENSPRRAGQRRISRGLTHFQFCTAFHCHFASQDRNASPKKAGGAVSSKPLNKRDRKTGRPGPAVRDIGQFAFARF